MLCGMPQLVGKNDKLFLELLEGKQLVVTEEGDITRWTHGRYVKALVTRDREGYLSVRVRWGGSRFRCSLSRVVWMSKHRRLVPPGCDIHHINGNNQDNRAENLQALTPAEHRKNGSSFGEEDGLGGF